MDSDLPWNLNDKVVTPDNIEHAEKRLRAFRAIQTGTATAEDREFIRKCDEDMKKVFRGG